MQDNLDIFGVVDHTRWYYYVDNLKPLKRERWNGENYI